MSQLLRAGDHDAVHADPVREDFGVLEIAGTALAGAMVGGLTLGIVGSSLSYGRKPRSTILASRRIASGALVGAISGALAGWQRIYDWRSRRGRTAFLADHSWAVMTTGAGVVAAGANLLLRAKVDQSLSRRQNRLVFDRGFVLRPGFALSTGYVVSGAADRNGRITPRRRRLVTDHEDVHIWQARRWGPLYPALYGGWFVGGIFVGLRKWFADRSGRSLFTHIDAAAYYSNPFEWRAYTDDQNWPPASADPTLVWSRRFSGSLFRDS